MFKLKKILLIIYLCVFSTGCTLPLIWDSTGPTAEPPVGIESSPTATAAPEIPNPPAPTDTPLQPDVTPTPIREPETPEPNPIAVPTPVPPPYILQPGSPVAVPNFTHPELGCNWLGVGGQIFDQRGRPQKSIIVEIGGTLAGIEINKLVVSGGAAIFGEGGYELTLSERPIGSDETLWIQLFDVSGRAVSEQIHFSTINDCGQNLILINFVEVPNLPFAIYLPMIDG